MQLTEVIKQLQDQLEEWGDVPVFVNGEHGHNDPEVAQEQHFMVETAETGWGGDEDFMPFGIKPTTDIMQIGGF